MKKLKKLSVLMLALVVTGCSATTAMDVDDIGQEDTIQEAENDEISKEIEYESLFEKDSVTKVEVTIDEENWQAILDAPDEKEYYSADIAVNGIEVDNVGFRAKGNSSLNNIIRTDSERYSFKVKMDKFEDDQTLLGLDKFVLNNMYADPSYMREYLHYEALDLLGEVTPLNAFAAVYINEEFYGLYLMVESIEESFIERNFENTDGNLYNQDTGSYLQLDESGEYERSDQKLGEDESKADLHTLVQTLDEMELGDKGNIEEVLDVDSALRNFATNIVFGNFDSYNSAMGNNYYLYSQDGYFTMLPWDYNMSIGGFGGLGTLGVSVDQPAYMIDIEDIPLANKLLAVPEYRERYEEYIVELLEYVDNIDERVAEIQEIIEPYVEADPNRFYTMEEFYESIENTVLDQDVVIEAIESMEQMESVGGMQPPTDNGGDRQGMMSPEGGMGEGQGMMPPEGGMGEGEGMISPEGGMQERQGMIPPEDEMQEGQEMMPSQGGMQDRNEMRGGMENKGAGNPMGESDYSIVAYLKYRAEIIREELGI